MTTRTATYDGWDVEITTDPLGKLLVRLRHPGIPGSIRVCQVGQTSAEHLLVMGLKHAYAAQMRRVTTDERRKLAALYRMRVRQLSQHIHHPAQFWEFIDGQRGPEGVLTVGTPPPLLDRYGMPLFAAGG